MSETVAMSLDELCQTIKARFGDDVVITQREHGDGSAEAVLALNGAVKASWRSRLINIVPLDGVTPRGPKEYFGLKFYQ